MGPFSFHSQADIGAGSMAQALLEQADEIVSRNTFRVSADRQLGGRHRFDRVFKF